MLHIIGQCKRKRVRENKMCAQYLKLSSAKDKCVQVCGFLIRAVSGSNGFVTMEPQPPKWTLWKPIFVIRAPDIRTDLPVLVTSASVLSGFRWAIHVCPALPWCIHLKKYGNVFSVIVVLVWLGMRLARSFVMLLTKWVFGLASRVVDVRLKLNLPWNFTSYKL